MMMSSDDSAPALDWTASTLSGISVLCGGRRVGKNHR